MPWDMPVNSNKLKKITSQLDLSAILISGIFLFVILFVPNVKIFFSIVFLYFGVLVFEYGFAKALIYSMPLLSHIDFGQKHQILVVPPDAIISPQYLEGRHLNWSISPYLIISLIAACLFWWWYQQQPQKIKLNLSEKLLLILISSGFLSALYSSIMPGLSFYAVATSLCSIIWIFYLVVLGKNNQQRKWKIIWRTLMSIIVLLIIYESLIALGQLLLKNPVGLFIEGTQMSPVFGLGADETSGGFRPFGLSFHPNGLANHQLLLLISIDFLYSYLKMKNKFWTNALIWTNLISLGIIILTLSRAVYLAIILIAIFMYWRHPKYVLKLQKMCILKVKLLKMRHILLLGSIFAILSFKVGSRFLNSTHVLNQTGGISTRLVQYQEAWQVFLHSPFWGIGDKMFIPTSYQLFPQGVMTYFPENVHNGYLLLLLERGILGLSLYLIFLFTFIKSIHQSSLLKTTKTLLYSGLIAGLTVMFLHPEKNFFSMITLIGIIIIHYEKQPQAN